MQLKNYFSGTVEAAMEMARQDSGPEALLVNARPEARYSPLTGAPTQPGVAGSQRFGRALGALRLGLYDVALGVVNSPLTPEVLKSPKASEALNGRARERASTPAPLNPLLKSSLLKQRAAA